MRTRYTFTKNGKQWASIWSDYRDDAVFKFVARLVEVSNKDFFEVFHIASTGDLEKQLVAQGFTIEEQDQ